jgi:hypothetical protein
MSGYATSFVYIYFAFFGFLFGGPESTFGIFPHMPYSYVSGINSTIHRESTLDWEMPDSNLGLQDNSLVHYKEATTFP